MDLDEEKETQDEGSLQRKNQLLKEIEALQKQFDLEETNLKTLKEKNKKLLKKKE